MSGLFLLGVLANLLDISGGPLGWIAGISLNYVGFGVAGIFVVAWVIALGIWHLGRVEQRWTARIATAEVGNTASSGPYPEG